MAESRRWAERSVIGYDNGEKERSRAYARPGIDKSVDKQQLGKAGECAVCLYLSLDPAKLDWGPFCDYGWDLEYLRHLVDVKATDTEYLMWPVTKNGFLHDTKAELFVLARRLDNGGLYEMSGWVTKPHFILKHHSAPPPDFLDEGTKHLHHDELWPIEELLVSPVVRSLLTNKVDALVRARLLPA